MQSIRLFSNLVAVGPVIIDSDHLRAVSRNAI
jgi:hypothetical protein